MQGEVENKINQKLNSHKTSNKKYTTEMKLGQQVKLLLDLLFPVTQRKMTSKHNVKAK